MARSTLTCGLKCSYVKIVHKSWMDWPFSCLVRSPSGQVSACLVFSNKTFDPFAEKRRKKCFQFLSADFFQCMTVHGWVNTSQCKRVTSFQLLLLKTLESRSQYVPPINCKIYFITNFKVDVRPVPSKCWKSSFYTMYCSNKGDLCMIHIVVACEPQKP